MAREETLYMIRERGMHDQVDMVCHQAQAVDSAMEFFGGVLEEKIESLSVPFFEEERFTGVAAKIRW